MIQIGLVKSPVWRNCFTHDSLATQLTAKMPDSIFSYASAVSGLLFLEIAL